MRQMLPEKGFTVEGLKGKVSRDLMRKKKPADGFIG
jgi:hypothetical protein